MSMAGFGQAKAAELKAAHEETKGNPFEDLEAELNDVNASKPNTHIFLAVVGKENTGKSAIIFDYYQKYCDNEDEVNKDE